MIILITGANRGLGLEVSRQLGLAGHTVLVGCRDEQRGAEAEQVLRKEGINAHAIQIDVANPDSISTARQMVQDRFQELDVLVNNAAINYDNWERVTAVDWKVVQDAFEVNTIGAWKAALEFLPLLKSSAHPRIVNVSSEAGSLASMSGSSPAYSVSKVALNAVTRMLASELKKDNVLVNAVSPGWTFTEMGGAGGRPVAEGAKSIVWAATLPDDGPTGGFFRDGVPLNW